jgi:hypothetical protein
MTAVDGRNRDYYDGTKLYTYRSQKLLCWMPADHLYISVENTMDRYNALGVLRLRNPQPTPSLFGFNEIFRKEWGWDAESFAKGYFAYEIHDRRLFINGPISVHYGVGPQFAGYLTVADVDQAMNEPQYHC